MSAFSEPKKIGWRLSRHWEGGQVTLEIVILPYRSHCTFLCPYDILNDKNGRLTFLPSNPDSSQAFWQVLTFMTTLLPSLLGPVTCHLPTNDVCTSMGVRLLFRVTSEGRSCLWYSFDIRMLVVLTFRLYDRGACMIHLDTWIHRSRWGCLWC